MKRLASLARKFRARRIDAGALTLASPEVKFVLDSESLNPTDVAAYTLYEANALVDMDIYNCTFPAMITDWRLKWGEGTMGQTRPDFPFGFVQVAQRE